jgi:methyltransferase OMS1
MLVRNPLTTRVISGQSTRSVSSAHTHSPSGARPDEQPERHRSSLSLPEPRSIIIGVIVYGIAMYIGYEYISSNFIQPRSVGQQPEERIIMQPVDTTPVYEKIAKEYDSKIWLEELVSYIWWFRRKLARNAKGDVLEVACGTGRNIKYLPMSRITSITFLDSSEEMLQITLEKFQKKFPNVSEVQFVKAKAENLAEVDTSGQKFDTIMESFGLCSHEDPNLVLQNMRQLLKPNGRIVLLEHGRSTSQTTNVRMDRNAEKRLKEWGCRYNLDIDEIVQSTGLEIVDSGRYQFGTTYYYVLKEPGAK